MPRTVPPGDHPLLAAQVAATSTAPNGQGGLDRRGVLLGARGPGGQLRPGRSTAGPSPRRAGDQGNSSSGRDILLRPDHVAHLSADDDGSRIPTDRARDLMPSARGCTAEPGGGRAVCWPIRPSRKGQRPSRSGPSSESRRTSVARRALRCRPGVCDSPRAPTPRPHSARWIRIRRYPREMDAEKRQTRLRDRVDESAPDRSDSGPSRSTRPEGHDTAALHRRPKSPVDLRGGRADHDPVENDLVIVQLDMHTPAASSTCSERTAVPKRIAPPARTMSSARASATALKSTTAVVGEWSPSTPRT